MKYPPLVPMNLEKGRLLLYIRMYNIDARDFKKEESMKEATVAELRENVKHYVDYVSGGGTVKIYRRGKYVADITPARKASPSWKSPVSPVTIRGLSLSKEIIRDRKRNRA